MTFEWKVYVKNKSNVRVGEVDDYTTLEMSKKFNDVGAWILEIDQNSSQIANLRVPGYGILVTRNGEYFTSGPVVKSRFAGNATKGVWTFTGADENIWLNDRLVSPSPTESDPYTVEFDVRTGVASTIMQEYVNWNLDNLAIVPRRKSGFSMALDPVIGSTVTGRGRWQKLLLLLQELAILGGDLGFKCVQSGLIIEFQIYQPEDKTVTAKFAFEYGNLESFDYEVQRTEGNYLYVGGSGDGATRAIHEHADTASMAVLGRIEGEFIDGRDTNLDVELNQEAVAWLAQNGPKTSLSLSTIDTPNTAFGIDYELGDIVTVEVNGEVIQDVVREVTVRLASDKVTVSPTIGTGRLEPLKILKTLAAMRKRLANIERRK